MKLQDYIRSAQTSCEDFLEHISERIVTLLVEDFRDGKNPGSAVMELKKRLSKFDEEWKKMVTKKVLIGYKCTRVMIQGIPNYSIDHFIKNKYDFKIYHKRSKYNRMDYSLEKFLELSKMEVALLLYKYGDDILQCEIRIAVLELLMTYFELYNYIVFPTEEGQRWCLHPDHLNICLNTLFNMDVSEFKKYFKYFTKNFNLIKHDYSLDIEYPKKNRPNSKDEIMRHYKDGMTQKQFDEAIGAYWSVCIRTARKWKKEFGITRPYKSEKTSTDYITTSNNKPCDISIYENKISELNQKIIEQERIINSLKKGISDYALDPNSCQRLQEENRNLKNSNKRFKEDNELLKKVNTELQIMNENLKRQTK